MDHETTRRRFSNIFNPPELYNEESASASDSSTEEASVVAAMDTDADETSNQPSNPEPATEQPPLRRSGRKKIRTNPIEIVEVSSRPVKLSAKSSDSAIKKYYLDKKVKKLNPSLETIYEEPQVINNEVVMMSTRKFKRMITFEVTATKTNAKIKKRKAKTSKLKHKKILKKVSMEFFNEKLQKIDE